MSESLGEVSVATHVELRPAVTNSLWLLFKPAVVLVFIFELPETTGRAAWLLLRGIVLPLPLADAAVAPEAG